MNQKRIKRVLVLCSGYPSVDNPYNCTWAHIRNRYYLDNGLNVEVFVTGSNEEYEIDSIKVISKVQMTQSLDSGKYDLIISHSPNLRGHLPILNKYSNHKCILFMHGTESMWLNHDYPKPYAYNKPTLLNRLIRDSYDFVKFIFLRRFILGANNAHIVFVSKWMKDVFEKNVVKLEDAQRYSIINNSLNQRFFESNHTFCEDSKNADFITLRRLDLSKYAIDLVCSFAKSNPQYKFHIYGKGNYFDFNEKPDNVDVFDYHIKQDDIPELLNKYPAALMPTRCDAQGVMACEIATYGMPIITTDIDVNREMFSEFENVTLLCESEFSSNIDLKDIKSLSSPASRNVNRFCFEKTLRKELDLIGEMI